MMSNLSNNIICLMLVNVAIIFQHRMFNNGSGIRGELVNRICTGLLIIL